MAAAQESKFAGLGAGGKILLLVLMLGVLTAIYFFAAHRPLSNDIEAAENRYQQLVEEERVARQQLEQFHQLTMELTQRQALDRRNKRILPEEAEIAAFLQDLHRLAELSGLEIHLVEPRPEEPERLFVRLPVTLQLSGRYHQVMKFFYNVSRLDRAISMEDLHLDDPEREGDEVTLRIDVLATTFRRADAERQGRRQGGGT